MIRAGLEAFREMPRSTATSVVLFTDLHAANILRAEREPWLAIDPKPYVGDPTYDALQHMLNESRLAVDPLGLVARMADRLELDRGRLRSWLFARCAIEAIDEPEHLEVMRQIA
jgi:streptomycin 6-kinase